MCVPARKNSYDRLTNRLLTQTRTQIVNELDSAMVICNMDLFSGCTVVESGTGSGCMTLALARTVAPHGHVFTYEYNPVRAETAKEEFKRFRIISTHI